MIGILCALDREIELLLKEMEQPAVHKKLFGYDSSIPQSISIFGLCLLLGYGFFRFVDHFIFEDIRKLSSCMQDVMTGDFSVNA